MFQLSRWPTLLTLLAQWCRLRRVLGRQRIAACEVQRQRAALYERIWREAAESVAAEIESHGDGVFEITRDAARIRVRHNETPLDDPLTLAVSGDKPRTFRLLTRHGLRVPPYAEFQLRQLDVAAEFLGSAGGPCVVKPARDTGAGRGVTTSVTDQATLTHAATLAASFGPSLLIEKQITGANYRLLYLDGTLLDAVVRKPPTVLADGLSSIHTLIQQANTRRLAVAACSQFLITTDLDLRRTLARQGLSLGNTPESGTVVLLKSVVNENCGSENESATNTVCESIVADGARAAAAVGARLAGVDIITPDPSVSLADAGGVIGEVNTTPGLYYHYHKAGGPTPVAVPILERMLVEAGDPVHENRCVAANKPAFRIGRLDFESIAS